MPGERLRQRDLYVSRSNGFATRCHRHESSKTRVSTAIHLRVLLLGFGVQHLGRISGAPTSNGQWDLKVLKCERVNTTPRCTSCTTQLPPSDLKVQSTISAVLGSKPDATSLQPMVRVTLSPPLSHSGQIGPGGGVNVGAKPLCRRF